MSRLVLAAFLVLVLPLRALAQPAGDPGDPVETAVEAGLAALDEERFAAAREVFQEALGEAKQSGDALATGRVLFYLGLTDQLEAAAQSTPASGPLLASAAARYEEVLRLLPDDGESLNNLAQVRRRQGRPADAAAALERAMAVATGDQLPFFARNYGRLLLEDGDVEGALAAYGRAAQAAPDDEGLQEELFQLVQTRAPETLPSHLAQLVATGQVLRAERYAANLLAARSGAAESREQILTVLATALARMDLEPAGFQRSPTAAVLERVSAEPGIGPGARQLLLLAGGGSTRPEDFGWWSERGDAVAAVRELARSLADGAVAAGDPERSEAYYRLAEDLDPRRPDLEAALGRADLYAATGRDDDLQALLSELSARVPAGEPDAVEAHTSLGVLYDLLWRRSDRRRPELLDASVKHLEQAYTAVRQLAPGGQSPPGAPYAIFDRLAQGYEAKGRGDLAARVRLDQAEAYRRDGLDSAARELVRQLRSNPARPLLRDSTAETQLQRLERQLGMAPGAPIVEIPDAARRPSLPGPSAGVFGQLSGRVIDPDGAPLPGVTVTAIVDGLPLDVRVTDAQGRFGFRLPPRRYTLKVELEGFSSREVPDVDVGPGASGALEIRMETGEDVISISGETPLLDFRRAVPGEVDLLQIPTSRDPWVIPRSVSGVLLDRVNVGGNESGHQSFWIAPTQEERSRVGLPDASTELGSPQINLVTGAESKTLRGSARASFTDEAGQASTGFDAGGLGRPGPWNGFNAQAPFAAADRVLEAREYGAEAGGPLIPDRLFLWGLARRDEQDLASLGDVRSSVQARDLAFRADAQLTESNALDVLVYDTERDGSGRGASPDRSPEATWDEDRSTALLQVEDTHVFSSRFLATALGSRRETPTTLSPMGGGEVEAEWDSSLVWRRSVLALESEDLQTQLKLDGSAFLEIGDTGHELKSGLSFRRLSNDSSSSWPGNGTVIYSAFGPNDFFTAAEAFTPSVTRTRRDLWGLYIQDTLSRGDLTANLGVRYDLQTGRNLASSAPPHPLAGDSPLFRPLAGGAFGGDDPGLDWQTVSPRLGVTYTPGDRRRAVLRAHVSRFADPLGEEMVLTSNPLARQSVYFGWLDLNGNGSLDPSEAFPAPGSYLGVDPQRPGLTVLGGFERGFGPGITDEAGASWEQTVTSAFTLEIDLRARRRHDIPELERLVYEGERGPGSGIGRPHRRSDYEPFLTLTGELPTGEAYQVPVYRLRPGVTWLGGYLATTGSREQRSEEATLRFNRRMVSRWMLRGSFTWSRSRWKVPVEEREDPTNLLGSHDDDGATVLREVPGIGAQPPDLIGGERWSFQVTGAYQIAPERRWGFDLGLQIAGREGAPVPYFRRVGLEVSRDGITRFVQVTSRPDAVRTEDLFTADARLSKDIRRDDWTVNLGVEVLNLTNEGDVLRREGLLGFPRAGHVEQITSPRLFRLTLRLLFR